MKKQGEGRGETKQYKKGDVQESYSDCIPPKTYRFVKNIKNKKYFKKYAKNIKFSYEIFQSCKHAGTMNRKEHVKFLHSDI